MAAPHKFLFDRSFDQPDPPPRLGVRPAAPQSAAPPEPSFTQAQIEAARSEGYAVGRSAALAEAMHSIEERMTAILKDLSDRMEELLKAREQALQETQRQSLETIRLIAQKAVPALCRKEPLLEIESLVADCLREAFDEPRLVLRIADPLFDAVQGRLGALTTSTGFAGKVVLLADETLGPGDVRVEWAEGGAERNTRRLIGDIDGALARALEALSQRPTPSPEGIQHE